MSISLITTSRVTLGIRQLSAVLKQEKGISPKCFFLGRAALYDRRTLDHLYEHVKEDVIVGISVIENTFRNAVLVSKHLRKRGYRGLILMGGQYAIMCPEDCIEHADLVCIGDGEEMIVQVYDALSAGADLSNIPNLWIRRKDGSLGKTPMRLVEKLDDLPHLDYFTPGKHFKIGRFGEIEPVASADDFKYPKEGNIINVFSRGCAYDCTYCCSSKIRQIYGKYRQNSMVRLLSELEYSVSLMKGENNQISIMDDDFFLRPEEEIAFFAREYKKKIGKPLLCHARLSSITRSKLGHLLDAGLYYLYTGVQSASLETSDLLYGRKDLSDYETGIDIFFNMLKERHLEKKVTLAVDFIVLNPFIKKKDMLSNILYVQHIWEKHQTPFFVFPRAYRLFKNTVMYHHLLNSGYKDYAREYQEKMAAYFGFGYLFVDMKYSQQAYLEAVFLFMGGWQRKIASGSVLRGMISGLVKEGPVNFTERFILKHSAVKALFNMGVCLFLQTNLELMLRTVASTLIVFLINLKEDIIRNFFHAKRK